MKALITYAALRADVTRKEKKEQIAQSSCYDDLSLFPGFSFYLALLLLPSLLLKLDPEACMLIRTQHGLVSQTKHRRLQLSDFRTVFSSNCLGFTQNTKRIWTSFPGDMSQENLGFIGLVCDREDLQTLSALASFQRLEKTPRPFTDLGSRITRCPRWPRAQRWASFGPHKLLQFSKLSSGLSWTKQKQKHTLPPKCPHQGQKFWGLIRALPTTLKQSNIGDQTPMEEQPVQVPAGRDILENHLLLTRDLRLFLDHPRLLPGVWCWPFMPTPVSAHSYHQSLWNQKAWA